MRNVIKKITLSTDDPIQIIDVTERVKAVVRELGIKEGMVSIGSMHTTCTISINEKDPGLQRDMVAFIARFAPEGDNYLHNLNTEDGRSNAHSHLVSLFMNTSETLPVGNGEPILGGWQSVFFIELDGPRKERTIVVQVMGE